MKKMFFILILIFLALLTACQILPNKELNTSSSTTESVPSNSATENEPIIRPSPPLTTLPTFCSIEEYQYMLKTTDLPENFVRYEDICRLGNFDCLVFLSNTKIGDYSNYMYNFIDANGVTLALYVYHYDPYINTDDFRKIDTDQQNWHHYTGAYYSYSNGKLFSVEWIREGKRFVLFDNNLFEYPLDKEETITSRLLNENTVDEALRDLFESSSSE